MQRNCIFPERYAPLTYYEDVLEASRNILMARNAREICNFLAPIWTLLPEDVAVLNPTGYRTLKRRYPACVRHQNEFSHIVMMWYVVLTIGTQ